MDKKAQLRFWKYVDKNGSLPAERAGLGKCWQWIGYITPVGYGHMHYINRPYRAHRLSWELHRTKIPKGMTLDHLCRNRSCVNPKHLEVVTSVVNAMRGNSPWAKKARQTHCIHGHPLSGENLYFKSFGKRVERHCRECERIRCRKWKAKNKHYWVKWYAERKKRVRL